MAASSSELKVEIGHVLFVDIVGYSKLLMDEQTEQLQKLKEIVWATEEFRRAQAEGKLLRLPTGDGGALVFRNDLESPVKCALLKRHSELHVRMGIHSGPVNEVTDLNAQANIAGAGINIAQRVMDCADASHILLSRHVAEDLEQYPRWRSYLHDLGECEVKHGVRIGLVNFYSEEFGNLATPKKLKDLRKKRARTRIVVGLSIAAALAIAAGLFVLRKRSTSFANIPHNSIAVLPFVDMSQEKDQGYFSDGISEELLNLLAKNSIFRKSRGGSTWRMCWKARCARRATRCGSRRN
ncbi:MAG: hypothetical protein DME57_09740 [Verrucomicrobia bacterium]|nr:MAG: hypothetical protein DME57_09740 [Verrucomicrobiota bacterium]